MHTHTRALSRQYSFIHTFLVYNLNLLQTMSNKSFVRHLSIRYTHARECHNFINMAEMYRNHKWTFLSASHQINAMHSRLDKQRSLSSHFRFTLVAVSDKCTCVFVSLSISAFDEWRTSIETHKPAHTHAHWVVRIAKWGKSLRIDLIYQTSQQRR